MVYDLNIQGSLSKLSKDGQTTNNLFSMRKGECIMFKSKVWKRIIAVLLALIISVPVIPMDVHAATNDYTTWKQTDPAWNQREAWPRSEYRSASMRTMKEAGCVVTSIAMLLRHHNVVTESSVDKFNPWILNEQLKANGCFNSSADLYWDKVTKVYPSFKYVGSKKYSPANIKSLYKSGYACVIKANSYHYVALHSISGSTVNIMDPGYNRTNLSSYKNPVLIQYYAVPDKKPDDTKPVGSYATISGYNTPGNIIEGKTYSVRGTISSTSRISAVTAGIYTASSGGTMKTGKTVCPNTTSYNLAKIDPYIYFNKLSAGTYYYRVSATNSVGTKILVNSVFSITPKVTYASISNYNVPGSLKIGQSYSVKGIISSGSKITSVTAGVYTSASGGTRKTGKTVHPNKTSYNLKSVDAYIYFNKLPAGQYYYRVSASNSAGTKVLINSAFSVKSSAAYARISNYNVPGTLRAGQSYSIKGTITSATKLSSVTAGVYTSSSGGIKKTGRTVHPNKTSYNLKNVDAYVYFNQLPAGTYYYRVTASNSAGDIVLINRSFTVTAAVAYAKISGYNTPGSLKVGRAYSIRGTISSSTKITSVTVGVYTSSSGGTMKTGRTVRPNTTSYSISKIDPYVYFNRLSAGTYYYRITATNSAGSKTLVNTRFYVR